MSFLSMKAVLVAGVMAASVAVNATPLNDYNLILSGDFNVSGGSGHIEGKSFIGGNVNNGSIFSQYVDKATTADTVKVVGNFNGNNAMHIEAGYVAYGGNLNNVPANQDWCNGNNINSNASCFHKVTDGSLAAEKASILSQLAAESAYYDGLATSAGTSVTGDSNNKTMKYSGAASNLVVFNISGSDLMNVNWSLDFGSAVNILINVTTGANFNAGNAHVNNGFQNHVNNILWNFADATSLTFGDSWYGSVLALNADIYTPSNLNGAIAAKSYSGNGEIHQGKWTYTPPTTTVPEPSSGLLALLAIGLLSIRRLRRA